MAKREFQNKVVVVTGASGGLGRALADRFGRAGARLALLDLDRAALDEQAGRLSAAGVESLGLVCDVSDEPACLKAMAGVGERFGGVDVLINNAGITHRSPFAETDCAVMRRVVEVNLFGAMHCTKHALKSLIERRGQVIVISSLAGLGPLDGRAGYSASKHALHGMFETLRCEMRPHGVRITMVCPTFVDTGIDRAAMSGDGRPAARAKPTVGRVASADEIVEKIMRAAGREQRLLIPSWTGKLAYGIRRLAPAVYERLMSRSVRREFEK